METNPHLGNLKYMLSNSLIHVLSLSNSHTNVASIQKNRGDKWHRVIVALYGDQATESKLRKIPFSENLSALFHVVMNYLLKIIKYLCMKAANEYN